MFFILPNLFALFVCFVVIFVYWARLISHAVDCFAPYDCTACHLGIQSRLNLGYWQALASFAYLA